MFPRPLLPLLLPLCFSFEKPARYSNRLLYCVEEKLSMTPSILLRVTILAVLTMIPICVGFGLNRGKNSHSFPHSSMPFEFTTTLKNVQWCHVKTRGQFDWSVRVNLAPVLNGSQVQLTNSRGHPLIYDRKRNGEQCRYHQRSMAPNRDIVICSSIELECSKLI